MHEREKDMSHNIETGQAGIGLTRTPAPAQYAPGLAALWREVGSHWMTPAGGSERVVCYCGPANHLTGPQWADGDPRTAEEMNR